MRQRDGQAEFFVYLSFSGALDLLASIYISRWKCPQAAPWLHRPLLQEDAALIGDDYRRRDFRIQIDGSACAHRALSIRARMRA